MKPLRIPSQDLPGLGLCLAAVLIGVGIFTYWKEGSLVEPLFCIGLSIAMGYSASTELLWIEIGTCFTYRTLLQPTQTHEWVDVEAVDIENSDNGAESDQLAIRLVTGRTLKVPTSHQYDIYGRLSELLKDNDLDQRVRQQVEAVIMKFHSPGDQTKG